MIKRMPWVVPLPSNSGNEGFGWDSLLQRGHQQNCQVQCLIKSGQFITTSAEVTPNGGLVRESPPKWP